MIRRLQSLFGGESYSDISELDMAGEATQEQTALEKRYPVDVADADFESVVLQEERLVVVDFWADWCQPCTIMSVHMGFLLEELGDEIVVAAMDVEENPDTPAKYGIQGLPTLILFKNGEEVDRQVGLVEYDSLKQRVQSLL